MRLICFYTLLLFCFNLFGQRGYVQDWLSILNRNSPALIRMEQTEPDSNWFMPDYNDAGWAQTSLNQNYGTDTIKTFYLRIHFTIENRERFQAMLLQSECNGGFVAYLNGFEVLRNNMDGSFNHPVYSDTAMYPVLDSSIQDGLINERRLIYALIEGKNTLAVQVHSRPEFDNIFLNLYTYLGSPDSLQPPHNLPGWFTPPPVFNTSSNLPIIYIDTHEKLINDSSKITASMGIIHNSNGSDNYFDSAYNHYNGYIGIKTRGQSSLEFPKKSYAIETQTAEGENYNESLLGMPEENDWVLYGPYADKSLIRNSFSYELFEQMGHYSPKCRFVELINNGYYQGVYVLTEKIKKDKNRVDIATLRPSEIAGDDVTGGYILRNDKGGILGYDSWFASTDLDNTEFNRREYILQYPDPAEIAPQQLDYIKNFCDNMEASLLSLSYSGDMPEYLQYIDLPSWTDKFIITELSKDIDSYKYSQYMYKEKNSNGGKLYLGPIWDLNTGYGNVNYGSDEPWSTENWMIYNGNHRVWWFRQLLQDPHFINTLYNRWFYLRENTLSEAAISKQIDSLTDLLAQAQERNHYQWNTLGRYVWPNYFVADSYEEEIDYLKSWISDRLLWLDENMPEPIAAVNPVKDKPQFISWPNPANETVHFGFATSQKQEAYSISLYTLDGKLIKTVHSENGQPLHMPIAQLEAGMYPYTVYQYGMAISHGRLSVL